MMKRPKPGEDEDDILRMQEEFLAAKNKDINMQPAAQVVNLRTKDNTPQKRPAESATTTRKPSKYAQSKGLKNLHEKKARIEGSTGSVMGDIFEKNLEEPVKPSHVKQDDSVYYPKIIPSVLGEIVEKNLDDNIQIDFNTMPMQGFPVALRRDVKLTQGIDTFHSQHLKKINEPSSSKMDVDVSSMHRDSMNSTVKNLPDKNYILNSKEANEIHTENISVLNRMSEAEILEEQKKIMSNIDPTLLEFIKSRRKQPSDIKEPKNREEETVPLMDTSAQNPATESQTFDNDSLWDNDVLSHPNVHKWIHFESLEKDKLEWMKGIEESSKLKAGEPYEARFDFKGYLLPYTIEYTENTKTLFHHGEEPHRPGYSFTELFELTRSTITQQRVMALNILAGILEYHSAGTYKDVIEIPLSKIFFVIRIAMDENKISILEPALKAMRSLIYNKIDEASLDALVGFEEGLQQPCLENDKFDIEELESKETELKDFHLAEIDLITILLRTDILQRIYYILDSVKPSFNSVQYSLQILTRLARDSIETSTKVVQTDHLMNTILKYFVPVTGINFLFDPHMIYNGKPVLAALKFLRILSLQSKEIADILVSKYDILKPISQYISSGVDGTYGLRIQIEASCVLSNLLNFYAGTESAVSLLPIIVTSFFKHVQGTDIYIHSSVISATHAAVTLQLINKILCCKLNNFDSYKYQIYPLLKDGIQKWLLQLSQAESYTCGHLRLLCAALDCCKIILLLERVEINFLNEALKTLSSSRGFLELTKQLIPSSNLLSGIEDTDLLVIKNLMTLRSSVIDSAHKVLPILKVNSPIPFLASLFKLLEIINNRNVSSLFLDKISEYMKKLTSKIPSLCDNWFTRIEVDFVFSFVKVSMLGELSETTKDILYLVANKLCYILRVDKRLELEFLFANIVFNKAWFTAERLMNLVSLSDADGFMKALTAIDDIKMCYGGVVNLGYLDTGPNVVLRNWREPILPRDWIYLPILQLYSKSQEVDKAPKVEGEHAKKVKAMKAKETEFIVSSSLEWILFNEMCFPDLLQDIELTDRFCRIMCIFLCDNSVFLSSNIKILLQKCTQILFKKEKQKSFNFDKPLVGLHNFQDFYTQFLEQFQSVSYGDYTFASCVLVPLAQKHNVKWRKLLWSEYAGCLRALDCPEELLCYQINDYLSPEETDESLIKSYTHALSSNLLRENTVAHRIASHHVKLYMTRLNSE